MPDNNPAAWPPAPPEGQTKADKPPVNNIAGWVSLAMGLIGVLANVAPFIVAARHGPTPMLTVPVEAVWWGAALVFGIIGRRSLPGKIGLFITLVVFILVVIVLIQLVAQSPAVHVSPPTVPSS